MKIKTIDFRDFMDGSYRQERSRTIPRTLAIAAPVDLTFSLTELIDLPPVISSAYLIVGAVGLVAIALTIAEKCLANSDYIELAQKIFGLGRILFPIAGVTAAFYLIFFALKVLT
jgi:hypothetical protein